MTCFVVPTGLWIASQAYVAKSFGSLAARSTPFQMPFSTQRSAKMFLAFGCVAVVVVLVILIIG